MTQKTVRVTTTSHVLIEEILATYLQQEDWNKVLLLSKLLKEEVDCWDDVFKQEIADIFAVKLSNV